jgi:hypothetical protein
MSTNRWTGFDRRLVYKDVGNAPGTGRIQKAPKGCRPVPSSQIRRLQFQDPQARGFQSGSAWDGMAVDPAIGTLKANVTSRYFCSLLSFFGRSGFAKSGSGSPKM